MAYIFLYTLIEKGRPKKGLQLESCRSLRQIRQDRGLFSDCVAVPFERVVNRSRSFFNCQVVLFHQRREVGALHSHFLRRSADVPVGSFQGRLEKGFFDGVI